LDQFAGRLVEWEAEGKTLAEMRDELKLDGTSVSVSALSVWLERWRRRELEKNLFEQIASGGRMNRELDAAFERNPAPEIDQLIRVSKSLIMSLQVKGAADPKLLVLANAMQGTVLTYLSGRTKAELETRKLELAEAKYRDQVEAAKGVMGQPELSAEEKQQRMRQIFGM
jgi:hypothetical protein